MKTDASSGRLFACDRGFYTVAILNPPPFSKIRVLMKIEDSSGHTVCAILDPKLL